MVLLLYNLILILFFYFFYSLHCPLSGPDLTYISLLIIPCIIYHVTNKETLTLTLIHVQIFCVSKSFIAVHASVNQASDLTVISSGRLHTPSNKHSNQRAKIRVK